MITELEIYWATRLDPLYNVVVSLLLVGIALFAVSFIVSSVIKYNGDDFYNAARWLRFWKTKLFLSLPMLIIGLLGTCFIPTTKEYIAMKVVPMVINNNKIQNISEKTLAFIEKVLDVKLKELTEPEKK